MKHEELIEKLQQLEKDTEELLTRAKKCKEAFGKDCINWGDLHCVQASFCVSSSGEESYRILIEECDPGALNLKSHIYNSLSDKYGMVEVSTEW